MRSFSKHNLIQQELSLLSDKSKNWLDRMFNYFYKTVQVQYQIKTPTSTYLRMEVFCEDVSDISEVHFTQRDLLSLLYDDFLRYAKKTDDVEVIYTQLMMKYQAFVQRTPILKQKNSKKQDDDRFPSYLFLDDEQEHLNVIEMQISFDRKKALRGEIILADMDEQFPDHPFTLEKILEMLLYDFIEEYRKGNHKMIMKKIVENLTK